MCNFFSCIVTRELRILFYEDNYHEHLIERAGLEDCLLENRNFVRLEISPAGKDEVTSRGPIPLYWKYKVDEEDTLPDWYHVEAKHIERAARVLARTVAVKKQKWLREYYKIDSEREDKIRPVKEYYQKKYQETENWDAQRQVLDEWDRQLEPINEYYEIAQKNLNFNYCETLADLPGYVKKVKKDGP